MHLSSSQLIGNSEVEGTDGEMAREIEGGKEMLEANLPLIGWDVKSQSQNGKSQI